MRVELKSGEYYDYYRIKRVEILDYDIVKIVGSLAKGTKSKTAQIHLRTIKNIREFNRFLKKEMKFFQADGVCPHCGSLKILELGDATYIYSINNPKAKVMYVKGEKTIYKCEGCSKPFKELKPLDLVIYYK